ncbi:MULTISPECIES: hypothetical protein [Streptomyces]|uniref:hypothetical protein n=1 Tax=Streptomyces TaxID=1883 RepID=UPI0007CD6498|nr:hypothetical protein A4V12_09820 [Streptomyces noursei]
MARKNALTRLVRNSERMDKDIRRGIRKGLGTKKKKSKNKKRAKKNQRQINALAGQIGQLTQQVSTLATVVAEDRKGKPAA